MNIRNFSIVALSLVVAGSAFASNLAMTLSCQGTVDKSVRLSAAINDEGHGNLRINMENGDRQITLVSRPSRLSDNYIFSTGSDDAQDNYSLQVRSALINRRVEGATDQIKLIVSPAYEMTGHVYDIACVISR